MHARGVKQRWKRRLAVCAIALGAKAAWVWRATPASALDGALSRRDHLLSRVLSPTYADDHALTPGGIYASEWQLVTLSMTAAALANLAFAMPETRAEHLAACITIVEQTLHPAIRAFEVTAWDSDPLDDLAGGNGHIGYLGHLGIVLGAHRVLGGDDRYDALHAAVSEAIARRMRASPSWHLETYPGQIYTADNSVGVAALAIWDMLSGQSHADAIAGWVAHTRARLLDPDNGIIVFQVAPDGGPIGRGRGSAAGYNSFYLPFIDAALAAEQRRAVQAHMLVDLPFGGIGVREYLPGIDQGGDVDTGPLLFGVSPSATGFFMAGARHAGDDALLLGLLRTAEIAGFSAPCRNGRCYWLAPLVGDAIVLAMRSATPWDRRYLATPTVASRMGRARDKSTLTRIVSAASAAFTD